MTRALWLPEALRNEGVRVIEEPGWRERGSSTFTPKGVVCHHTAGPASGDAPSLKVCIEGRSDVPGPLAHVVLARSGTAHVIASGRANHAGKGSWQGVAGNTNMFGIEAENTGLGERWPAAQLDAYVKIVAAMIRHIGAPVYMVCGHKEWAPGRKPDPRGIDMNDFRQRVQLHLVGPPATPTPIPPKKDTFMETLTPQEQHELLSIARELRGTAARKAVAVRSKTDGRVWIISDTGRWWCRTRIALDLLLFTGQIQPIGTDGPALVDDSWLAPIPEINPPEGVDQL